MNDPRGAAPHFLRVVRALAKVSGVAAPIAAIVSVVPSCGDGTGAVRGFGLSGVGGGTTVGSGVAVMSSAGTGGEGGSGSTGFVVMTGGAGGTGGTSGTGGQGGGAVGVVPMTGTGGAGGGFPGVMVMPDGG